MNCQRCGLPIFDGAAGYAGPQCKCFFRPPQISSPKVEKLVIPATLVPTHRLRFVERDGKRILQQGFEGGHWVDVPCVKEGS